MSERTLPWNQEAEQSVLGSALQNEYAADEASETLRAEDFFDKYHVEIFSVIAELIEARKPVDLVTVSSELKRRGTFDLIGGTRYLAELVSAVPAPTNVKHYADIVLEHSTRRKLIQTSEKIMGMAYSGEDDSLGMLDFAEREILEIGRTGQREDYSHIGIVVEENLKKMEELSKLGSGDLTGLTTGFPRLDRLTLGLQPSDLIILAARPGMGKTSLALNLALNAAFKAQAVVMIFSLEMSSSSLGMRLLSTQAEVDSKLIRNGQAYKDSAKSTKLGEAAQELKDTKLIVDDTSSIQISEIKNKCRRVKTKEGKLDLIVIDYLQLMDFGGSGKASSRPENRQQEIATITRMLKQLARDMDCPVLVLSQLSRDIERRSNKEPVLADLRESGAIEQDADIVMFIYQEADSDEGEGPLRDSTRQLSIAKHRNGETGLITLRWQGEFTKFSPYNPEDDVFSNL